MINQENKLKSEIEIRVRKIFEARKRAKKFIPGKTWIQYSGGVFDQKEINASISVLIDGWFGLGKCAASLEYGLAKFVGVKGSILTNSGSSSNLLAVASLCSFCDRINLIHLVVVKSCSYLLFYLIN